MGPQGDSPIEESHAGYELPPTPTMAAAVDWATTVSVAVATTPPRR